MKKLLLVCMLLLLVWAQVEAKYKRSRTAVRHFQSTHICPSTGKTGGPCPNYVVDHIKPLECGGLDIPENMQYQTIEEGKAKDKLENSCCKRGLVQ